MEKRITYYFALATVAVILFSCSNNTTRNHGPIVLGDSSTIVTENDHEKLRDLVADLKPEIKTSDAKDSLANAEKAAAQQKEIDSNKKKSPVPAAQPQAALSGSGLKADFGGITFLIPNVTARLASNPNLEKANSAVYSFMSGNIPGNMVQVTPNVTKVSQRYQTVIAVKNELGTLPLETLTTTTAWVPMKGANSMYKITGLEQKSLEFSDANKNAIRNAVLKSARRHRISRRKTQEWEESVRNARSVNQKPLFVILRSVMWKIDGKDANGKAFSKQIRVDLPL